jgi:hypothetical protein
MDYLYCGCPVASCPSRNVNRNVNKYWYGGKTKIRYYDINIKNSKPKNNIKSSGIRQKRWN